MEWNILKNNFLNPLSYTNVNKLHAKARRTFLSLTGIILLQAQIRSHLARKQFQPQVCAPNLEGNLVISTKTKESKQSLRKISISMAVASEQGPPQPQPASKPNS